MIERKVYVCSHCGIEFGNKNDAERHEAHHKKDGVVTRTRYCCGYDSSKKGFPQWLAIRFRDGSLARYTFNEPIGTEDEV